MKKVFFASALAVGLLSACTNDGDTLSSVPEGSKGEDGLVPIELAMKTPVSIVTRSIGTIGGVGENSADNVWRGETLYFNMFMKKSGNNDVLEVSTWRKITEDNPDGEDIANFDNEPLTVTSEPGDGSGVAAVKWTGAKYYPMDGTRHDFFAYHIDDAASELDEASKPTLHDETNDAGETILQKSVNFVINGSQDLMVGQADPNKTEDSYSAKSARAGVIPQIDMKHLLTRFTFEVVAGDRTADNLEVRRVSVVSKTTGRMLVGWHPNQAPATDDEKIIWDETVEPADLVLKQRPAQGTGQELEEMTPVKLAWNEAGEQEVIPVGEALMVSPMESEYVVHITTAQEVEDGSTNIYESEGTIKIMANGAPSQALPGTSYKVTVKLYGLSKIELTTKLTAWETGEDIEVDTATD